MSNLGPSSPVSVHARKIRKKSILQLDAKDNRLTTTITRIFPNIQIAQYALIARQTGHNTEKQQIKLIWAILTAWLVPSTSGTQSRATIKFSRLVNGLGKEIG